MVNADAEEVKVEKGIGIWGNTECAQCGACCYEWVKYLHDTGVRETERCESFEIRDGKAYCLAHDGERPPICRNYFCGNTDFRARFLDHGDETLRGIAEVLGTVPAENKIPKLLPIYHAR